MVKSLNEKKKKNHTPLRREGGYNVYLAYKNLQIHKQNQ